MCKIFFLFFQECISFRNGTFAFKDYSWEFQTALLLLNVYYLRWIFRPANTNQVRCFTLLDNRWPWCQRLFMRCFRFRSILYSERCAHICLALSQNSNVWRPNIHVWTHFEPIFLLRFHGWTQTTVSQLAGVRECRQKRQLSFLYNAFILMYRRPQLAISFESEPLSPANFHKPRPFCSSAATLARFFDVEIFWFVGESNTKFAV